eukprot:229807-Chlamydomonas_euryale.AAC.1
MPQPAHALAQHSIQKHSKYESEFKRPLPHPTSHPDPPAGSAHTSWHNTMSEWPTSSRTQPIVATSYIRTVSLLVAIARWLGEPRGPSSLTSVTCGTAVRTAYTFVMNHVQVLETFVCNWGGEGREGRGKCGSMWCGSVCMCVCMCLCVGVWGGIPRCAHVWVGAHVHECVHACVADRCAHVCGRDRGVEPVGRVGEVLTRWIQVCGGVNKRWDDDSFWPTTHLVLVPDQLPHSHQRPRLRLAVLGLPLLLLAARRAHGARRAARCGIARIAGRRRQEHQPGVRSRRQQSHSARQQLQVSVLGAGRAGHKARRQRLVVHARRGVRAPQPHAALQPRQPGGQKGGGSRARAGGRRCVCVGGGSRHLDGGGWDTCVCVCMCVCV